LEKRLSGVAIAGVGRDLTVLASSKMRPTHQKLLPLPLPISGTNKKGSRKKKEKEREKRGKSIPSSLTKFYSPK
jgi:hypothetical protein